MFIVQHTNARGEKKIICIPLFLPGFSHQEGRGACMNCDRWAAGRSEHPATPGHLRAPRLARKHRAHIPATCRPGSPQEPSGVPTWCIYIRGSRGEVRPWSAALHTWGSQSGDTRQCYGPWSPLLSQSHQRCQRTGSGCSKALTVDE